MADRLPFGEIRPAARPIGAFIQPGQQNVAGAARPQMLDNPSGIQTIQRASGGNVQGFNQFEQLAAALAPFSRALMDLGATHVISRAKSGIEEGYYAELKNQSARAQMGLQLQQEQGAANAAGTIGALQKVDPPAAELLRETNPWRAIGRRRALAQLAGGDVDNMLAADLQLNQGQLATIEPGSAALMQRKAKLTQLVFDRYGLTGDEPEAAFYVAPKVNDAWDKYTDKQQRLYNETLRVNGRAQVTAALGQALQQMSENGIPLEGGEVVPMGDPRFAQLAGRVMTGMIDRSLTFSGGQDRIEDLKEIRTQLLGTFGQVPVLGDALTFIEGGNPGDANRPTWGATYGLEILETRNRGNAARQQQYELGQKSVEQQLDGLWWAEGSPGSMLPTDPNYAAALINFRNRAAAAGYRDIDGYMNRRMDSQEAVVERAYAPDPLASEDFMASIQDLPRSAMNTPEAVQALREQARRAARVEPTPELQRARYKEYLDAIEAKQRQAADTTPGLQQAIDRALLQDLGLPQVKPIVDAAKAKGGGGDAFTAALQGGAGAMAAASGLGNDKVTAFTQRLNNLFLRNAEAKIDAWMAERPGVPLTSSARNVLISEAIAETRKSEEYKQAFQALTGKAPGEVGPGRVGPGPAQGTAPGPDVRGVSRTAAGALPDTTVRGFAVRPVMNGDWLYSELKRVSEGKPVSADLYRLANRAGTTTNRYLLEQLRFYPQLDPQGEARKYLEQKVRQQRQGQTVSSANWQGATRGSGLGMVPTGYNPLAPGSWLMNMLMPPAAAATMPANFPAAFGGGGGGGGSYVFSGSLAPFNSVLALLRSGEGGWDSANRGTAGDTPSGVPGLSRMTLGQWKGLQSRGYNALGAYQFIPRTLKLAASELGLSDNTVMTPEVQGRLAVQLMVGSKRPNLASYLHGRSNDIGAALDDLALEWASVHTRGGGTAYRGIGGNAASIPRSRAQQVLQQARAAYLGGGGGSGGRPSAGPAPAAPAGWRPARSVPRASEFGNQESFRSSAHEGADVSLRHGTPLSFSVGGQILAVYRTNSTARESNGGYGNYMDVRLDSGHVVRLAHLSQIPQGYAAGSRFTPGQAIGLSGGDRGAPGSGRSSGAHLHLEEHDRPGLGNAETTRGKRNPARRGGALDYLIWRG